MKRTKRKGRLCLCMAGIMLTLCLTGCGKDKIKDTASQKVFSIGGEKVYLDEVWIYARTVIEGYEKKYGDQVWAIETEDTDGQIRTMEEITRRDIIEDIRCTKILAGKAEGYKVVLTDEESEQAAEQSAIFYNNLTDQQIAEMGITRESAQRVFEENMLADKVYSQVMAEGGVEVSDEEARMTTLYDMYFACYKEDSTGNVTEMSPEERAQQKANAEEAVTLLDAPENPMTYEEISAKYNLQYGGERTMTYTDLVAEYGESLVTSLYVMENGTHTVVLETEYGYHIIGMLALTDTEATARRKAELLEARQKEYFSTVYAQWSKEADKNWDYKKDVDQDTYEQVEFGSALGET